MVKISTTVENEILNLLDGSSLSQREIADKVHVSPKTVGNVYRRNDCVSKIIKGGAPRKLDARADRELVRMIDLR